MSDYPSTICVSPESRRVPMTGRVSEISDGGISRMQDLYDETLYELMVVHAAATVSERTILREHWRDNRGTFYLQFIDGNEYNVAWLDEPLESYVAPGRWRIESRMIGVMQQNIFGYLQYDDGGYVLLPDGGGIRI